MASTLSTLDIVAVSATIAFLVISLLHALKEFISGFKSGIGSLHMGDLATSGVEKERLHRKIYRMFLMHLGVNDFVLFTLLILISAIICLVTKNYLSMVCFIVGSLTSVLSSFLAVLVSRRTAIKLVSLSLSGLGHVYGMCLGHIYKMCLTNSSGIVALSVGLNAASLFILTSLMTLSTPVTDVVSMVNTIALFAFGSLFVTLFSRLSGGLFTNASNILMDGDFDACEGHKALFENMNNYLQNIYQMILEVLALVSTLICTYFFVMGRYKFRSVALGNTFAYLNFPLLLLAFSMFVTVLFVLVFSFGKKNGNMKRLRFLYMMTMLSSLVVIFAFVPLFHAFFLPDTLEEVKFNKYAAYGLVGLGLKSGIMVGLSNHYFFSREKAPGRSVTMSALSSITGGLINSLSFAKLMSFLPIVCVCINVIICLAVSDFYGLIFVCIGFMCSLMVVLIGSIFYSLVMASSCMAQYLNHEPEIVEMFNDLTSSWYSINIVTRPFLSTWAIMLGLVLLIHQSKLLELDKFGLMNPYGLMAFLLGALFPIIQTGLILRISSAIANLRLKKANYLYLVKRLYIRDDYSRPGSYLDSGTMTRRTIPSTYRQRQKSMGSYSDVTGFGDNSFRTDRRSIGNQDKASHEQGGSESLEVKIDSDSQRNYRKFGGAFKNCLLKEAGVKEESLINAPCLCSSARSTQKDHLIPRLCQHHVSVDKQELPPSPEVTEEKDDSAVPRDYRHDSRDYRILKNADNHYKIFDPKYHQKHFNLKKRSTVASGSLEELKHLTEIPQQQDTEVVTSECESTTDDKMSDQADPSGDSLDKVYRRSENEDKVLRNLNLPATTQSSCGTSCQEQELPSLVKVVNNNQVHSMEPDSDSEDGKGDSDANGFPGFGNAAKMPGQPKIQFSMKELKKIAARRAKKRAKMQGAESDESEESADDPSPADSSDEKMPEKLLEPEPEKLPFTNPPIMKTDFKKGETTGSKPTEPEKVGTEPVELEKVETKPVEPETTNPEPMEPEPAQLAHAEPQTFVIHSDESMSPHGPSISFEEVVSIHEPEVIISEPVPATKQPTKKEKKLQEKMEKKEKKLKEKLEKKQKKIREKRAKKEVPPSPLTTMRANEQVIERDLTLEPRFEGPSEPQLEANLDEEAEKQFEPSRSTMSYFMDSSSASPEQARSPVIPKEYDFGHLDRVAEKNMAYEISVQQSLLPPDVRISDRPRRPTPRSIDLGRASDLEAGAAGSTTRSEKSLLRAVRMSPYQNTYRSLILSTVPLGFAFGVPFLVGVCLGKNGLHTFLLVSTVTSSLLVQVLTLFSMSWDSIVQTFNFKQAENEAAGIADSDLENLRTCRKVGVIVAHSVAPVLNTLIVCLPLVCLLRSDMFKYLSNSHGFPRWSSYGA